MILKAACLFALLVCTVHCKRKLQESSASEASFAALQDAKKDARADLSQVIDAIEAKFFPNKVLPTPTSAPPATTAAQGTTAAPATTLAPVTTSTPVTTPAGTTAAPATTLAPVTTPAVTTSNGPPASTPAPRTCEGATTLTFSGAANTAVSPQGPLLFPGWSYDTAGPSTPPTYSQAIYESSNSAAINVNDPKGIRLCSIAATGYYPTALSATFTGTILGSGGQTVTKTQAITGYSTVTDVTFDSSWQPLSSLKITFDSPIDVYAISYAL